MCNCNYHSGYKREDWGYDTQELPLTRLQVLGIVMISLISNALLYVLVEAVI